MSATYDSLLSGSTSPGLFSWRGRPDRDLAEAASAAGWLALSLDTTTVVSVDEFWDEIVATWSLPDWFGRNLDALFDTLADLAVGRTIVIWKGLVQLADVDPVLTGAVVDVFRDAIGQASSLAVVVAGDLGVSGFDGLL
ncbi:barstar family protein [Aeromicrobium sp.]|uniref:barstar family protein n=1 Tax=Aeromicrobium sp. TaxID=1871063 RepID=UPI003C55F6B5